MDERDLLNYINNKINANNKHLEMTKGTKYHEPEWYDGANTVLREMIQELGLENNG